MIEAILEWVREEPAVAAAIGALCAAAVAAFGIYLNWFTQMGQWLWDRGKKPEPTIQVIPEGASGILTLEAHEERLREQRTRIEAEKQNAHGAELDRLNAQMAEVESRLANSQKSFEDAQKTIADLTARLERVGNQIGGDRLAEARAALAEEDFDKAREIFEEVEARTQIEVQNAADAAYGLGEIAEAEIRWNDAANHYARAADLNKTYDTLNKAGTLLWRAGRNTEALRYNEDLVALSKREYGNTTAKTATAINNLALRHQELHEYENAETLYRQAIEIDKATIGERHPEHAIHLNNYATMLREVGRLNDAETLYRQAIEVDKATIGEGHSDYADHLNNLAKVLQDMGQFEEAEPLYRQAVEIDKATIGALHPSHAIRLNNLASLIRDLGCPENAKPLYELAVDTIRATLADDHPSTRKAAGNCARFLREHFPDDPAIAELEATFGTDIGRDDPSDSGRGDSPAPGVEHSTG